MPIHRVQAPDGTIHRIEAPEGANPDEVMAFAEKQFAAPKESPPAQEDRGFVDSLKRQAGLTARAGIQGVGNVLSLPGTIIDALTPDSLPKFKSADLFTRAADAMNLPKPEGAWERVGGAGAEALAGVGGMGMGTQALARGAGPVAKSVLSQFSDKPNILGSSAIGAGAGGQIAKENDYGPGAQMAASLAGGFMAPMGAAALRGTGGTIADIAATVGASRGHQASVDRLIKEVALNAAKGQREKQLMALGNRSQDIPGYQPTVAESLAEANIGQPGQFGGATIRLQKDLSGAQGAQDILPGHVRSQQVAIDKYKEMLNQKTAPMRDEALARVNGIEAQPIASRIDAMLQVPGIRASDVAQKALSDVRDKITSLGGESGMLHPSDVYTVRKEIGNTITRYSKETQNWDKRMTSGLEKQVQSVIDDAIEGAGGKGWRDYLRTYSEGMKKIEGAESRVAEAKKIGASVKGGPLEAIAKGEVPSLPTLLSRPMMATNWALKLFSQRAQDPIVKELASKMTNPEQYMKLLTLPPTHPLRIQAEQIMRNAALIDTMGGRQ